MAASKLGLLLWFRLLEGDLGGGGNGQHVENALSDACMHSVDGWVVTKLGPGSNVGTVVLLARDDAAHLLDGTYSLKFYILEQKSRTFVKTVPFLSVIRLI